MDGVAVSSVATSPGAPYTAEPIKEGVSQGVDAKTRHIERQAEFVKRGSGGIGRNQRLTGFVPFVEF